MVVTQEKKDLHKVVKELADAKVMERYNNGRKHRPTFSSTILRTLKTWMVDRFTFSIISITPMMTDELWTILHNFHTHTSGNTHHNTGTQVGHSCCNCGCANFLAIKFATQTVLCHATFTSGSPWHCGTSNNFDPPSEILDLPLQRAVSIEIRKNP